MITREYAKTGVDIIALDLSFRSLDYLRNRIDPISVVQGDVGALPFMNGYFNKALCANTLQHLPSSALRAKAVSELARVTKQNGSVIVTAHCLSRNKIADGWVKEGNPGQEGVQYIFRFETNDFEELLSRHFRSVRVTGCGLPFPYRFRLTPFSRVAERLASRLPISAEYGHMLLAVCRQPIKRTWQ